MSAVTVEDIQRIIDGGPIPIEVEFPLPDPPPDGQWFMAQPTDWQFDLAQAVREAAVAEAHSLPEIKAVDNLPPTDGFIARQLASKKNTEARIAELNAKGDGITPEEDIERASLKEYLARIIDPKFYSRADEIVAGTARKALENWLMPRLIVDNRGKPMFNMSTPEGNRRWLLLGREVKAQLGIYFYQAFMLIQTAKNYKSGQSSN